MGLFNRKAASSPETLIEEPKSESTTMDTAADANRSGQDRLARYNHNGHLVTRGIHPDGESGRRGKTLLAPISLPAARWRRLETTCAVSLSTRLQSVQRLPTDLLLLKLCRCPSMAFRPGCLEKLQSSVQMGQLTLAFRSRCHRPPFRTSGSSRMDLCHQLHRNGPCSKSHWLRRSRASPKDAESGWNTG